jgi:polyisoprenoid-binding protein YceI
MSTTKWALDAVHSEVHFKVKHMLVSTVTGQFKTFNATVETQGDDITTAKVHFAADVSSISTNNDQRDGHLKTGDFFDAENHPQIIFDGAGLEKADGDNYKLHGTLNMRGVSKPVTLNVEYGGVMQDPYGNTRTGFSVTGKVNRKEYGVSFNTVSEAGSLLLGEEVTISANVELVQEKALQPA